MGLYELEHLKDVGLCSRDEGRSTTGLGTKLLPTPNGDLTGAGCVRVVGHRQSPLPEGSM